MPGTVQLDAVIIGAGLSGLYALYRLRQEGLRVRAYDEAGDVGGTWWWNRYPGARVDSPGAPFYGYTFSDELAHEWVWKDTQPDQSEILGYLRHMAERYDLRKDIELSTRVESAVWDDPTRRWRLKTASQEIEARFLISAVGTLSASFLPNIPGAADFAGEVVHTGHWPENGLDVTGKRVGVIGTGSSGVQVIPFLAREAKDLVVFQRTPQYVLPGRNRPIDPAFLEGVKENWRAYRDAIRATGRPFEVPVGQAVDASPAQRQEVYEEAWRIGGLAFALCFTDHMTDAVANGYIADFVRTKIKEVVAREDVVQKLLPTFLFGGKRLILGEGYYETFNRDNVSLVDLREDPLECITASGVRTRSRTYDLDVLVWATGYDALTGALLRLNPVGTSGTLASKWREGVRTYLGLGVHGFPNLFMIHGPQTPSVKYHMGMGAEKQVDWIADLIQWMQTRDFDSVQPFEANEGLWAEEVRRVADRTLYPQTDSWFSGANIPGKPKEFMIHVNGAAYHKQIVKLAAEDYSGFQFERASTAGS